MFQKPDVSDLEEYCVELKECIVRNSPIDTQQLQMTELADLVQRWQNRWQGGDSDGYAEFQAAMYDLDHEELTDKITGKAKALSMPLMRAMIADRGHSSKFHNTWSFRQWAIFTRAFGHELRHSHLIKLGRPNIRIVPDFVEYEVNDTTAEYHPSGEPVPTEKFCKPTAIIPKGSEECTVCLSEIVPIL